MIRRQQYIEKMEEKVWQKILLVVIISTLWHQEFALARYFCPRDIEPCKCSVRPKGGLGVRCPKTNIDKLRNVTTQFKKHETFIRYLAIREATIPRLPDFIFMGMDIRHLSITSSRLAILESNSLAALAAKLEILELSQNIIKEVPTKAIGKLAKTRYLTLSHNMIQIIRAKAFQGMDSLESLHLFDNLIKVVEPDAFRGVESLTNLNLGQNKLKSVPTTALARLKYLNLLDLGLNEIESIEESDFKGLSGLDYLKMPNNKIKSLDPYVFRNLVNMSQLTLESNRIERIDEKAFAGLEKALEWLTLQNNSIKEIPTKALYGMHKLRQFNFKMNNISEVNEDAFENFGRTIKFLHLDNNNIKSLPLTVFSEMHSLEEIIFAGNKITRMPLEVFQPVLEFVQTIDFHGNPLQCDCELLWYKQWLNKGYKKNRAGLSNISLKTSCWSEKDNHLYNVYKAPLEQLYCPSSSAVTSSISEWTPIISSCTLLLAM